MKRARTPAVDRDRTTEPGQEPACDKARFGRLYDTAPIGLMTLDATGVVVEINARALELLRVPYIDIIGKPLTVYAVPGDDRRALAYHIAVAARGQGTFTVVVHFLTPRSQVQRAIFLETRGSTDGLRQCQTAISLVAADRQSAQERLDRALLHEDEMERHKAADAKWRFERVTQAGTQLSDTLDFETTVSRAVWIAVPDVCSYCAVDVIDHAGRVVRAAFARADGEHEDLPLDPYAPHGSAAVIRSGKAEVLPSPSSGDLAGLATDASRIGDLRKHLVSYVCFPLRAHGRTMGAMTYARSSAPAYTPEDLGLLAELAHRAALAIDNARLYREAQDADQRKDEFLAMLGHELRNPLAAVVFAAATLRRRGGSDPGVLRVAEVVERQSKRLARLVDDLLDVARITRGKIALRPEDVALQEVVSRAVESIRPLFDERRHHLSMKMPLGPILLDADPTRLEQVVVNLLANAAKYTDPGGQVDLDVSVTSGGEAVVRVRDTGMGIPPEMLSQIFAPFAQINPSPDRADRGLGIGLTLARKLVELHGGRISAHSAGLGQGSEFVVCLPLVPPRSAPVRPEEPDRSHEPEPHPGANGVARGDPDRRRVLVVEDNPDLGSLMEEKLRSLGHEVRRAVDGTQAIEEALVFQPQLLLIDLGLPGLTGFEVARRLRNEPTMAGAVIVAVTGYGGDETRHQCLKAGFDHHFTKPLREEALMGLLRAS